ncbi:MAG: hypothetical protein PHN21_07370 [Erysipelotrichaceae bacterium]|nr:hypothetical protein [Erysipelotrichaceae bacterium]
MSTNNNEENNHKNLIVKDDEYVWVYEFSLWKNPTVLITIAKIITLASLIVGVFMFVITAIDDISQALTVATNVFMFTLGIMSGLLLIAYPLYSIINKGKYIVVFEMNDKEIIHRQLETQFSKNQVVSLLTTVVGALAKNPTVSGANILSATKKAQKTIFTKVYKAVINEKRQVIYLNDLNGFNQIYVEPEDFTFVKEYIIKRCPSNTKIVYK